jgi:hypothetical protein
MRIGMSKKVFAGIFVIVLLAGGVLAVSCYLADANRDRIVNLMDMSFIRTRLYGDTSNWFYASGDVNGDGIVNLMDMSFVRSRLFCQMPQRAVMSTIPEVTKWKADGVTEYRMDVYGDTRGLEVSDQDVLGVEWRVLMPEGLVYVRADFPEEEEDFFNGWEMDSHFNWVGLTSNSRLTAGLQGPSGVYGKLGSYWFVVVENATLGVRSFDARDVYFWNATANGMVRVPNENNPFSIVAP